MIAELHPGVRQRLDVCRQIPDTQDNPVPSAWLLPRAIRQRTGSRCAWTTEEQREAIERDTRERGKVLMLQCEPEMRGVEGRRARDIADLIAHAVKAEA